MTSAGRIGGISASRAFLHIVHRGGDTFLFCPCWNVSANDLAGCAIIAREENEHRERQRLPNECLVVIDERLEQSPTEIRDYRIRWPIHKRSKQRATTPCGVMRSADHTASQVNLKLEYGSTKRRRLLTTPMQSRWSRVELRPNWHISRNSAYQEFQGNGQSKIASVP